MSNAWGNTRIDHHPVAMMAAPGWRAAYLIDDDHSCHVEDLVFLAVCHVVECTRGTDRVTDDQGTWIHGYVWNDGYVGCGEEVGNFWKLIPAGMPDPTAAEVAKEFALRRKPGT